MARTKFRNTERRQWWLRPTINVCRNHNSRLHKFLPYGFQPRYIRLMNASSLFSDTLNTCLTWRWKRIAKCVQNLRSQVCFARKAKFQNYMLILQVQFNPGLLFNHALPNRPGKKLKFQNFKIKSRPIKWRRLWQMSPTLKSSYKIDSKIKEFSCKNAKGQDPY